MKNKIFKYGIPSGLVICTLGSILIRLGYLSEDYDYLFKNIYKLTLLVAILFLFYESSFLTEKFNVFIITVGIVFLSLLGINLLVEFEVIKISSVDSYSSLAFLIIVGVYTYHFLRKKTKTLLDFLKVTFVVLSVFCLILNSNGLIPDSYKYLTHGIFWIIILAMLFKKKARRLTKPMN
ncbi:hypothetical protein J8L85_07155 [Maribacter sp. MMG018]|uniref:hypothetical protein n=1 Tax=Maribacter sp. MMG018 TaxID=2822688 RepID=UPI001B381C16|nr:hypothetical protein [Maribacter sp. MMG018]MBQ4914208.1 hypothetical protein [Maribacter sp. MMG018]